MTLPCCPLRCVAACMLFQPGYPCVVVCASALFIGSEPRSDKEGRPAKTKAPAQMNATWKHALGGGRGRREKKKKGRKV